MNILSINSSNTSIKWQAVSFPCETILSSGYITGIGTEFCYALWQHADGHSKSQNIPDTTYSETVDFIKRRLNKGETFSEDSIIVNGISFKIVISIDDKCKVSCMSTVPLYNPSYIKAIKIFRKTFSNIPLIVACVLPTNEELIVARAAYEKLLTTA